MRSKVDLFGAASPKRQKREGQGKNSSPRDDAAHTGQRKAKALYVERKRARPHEQRTSISVNYTKLDQETRSGELSDFGDRMCLGLAGEGGIEKKEGFGRSGRRDGAFFDTGREFRRSLPPSSDHRG